MRHSYRKVGGGPDRDLAEHLLGVRQVQWLECAVQRDGDAADDEVQHSVVGGVRFRKLDC